MAVSIGGFIHSCSGNANFDLWRQKYTRTGMFVGHRAGVCEHAWVCHAWHPARPYQCSVAQPTCKEVTPHFQKQKKQTVKFRDHSTSFNPSIPVKIQKKQTMHEHKLFMNSKNASAPYHVKVLETLLFRCFVFGHTINPSSFHIYCLPPGEGQQWCRCILATCPKPSLSCQNSVP